MQIYLLAILLFFQTLNACQLAPANGRTLEATSTTPSNITSIELPEEPKPSVSNLVFQSKDGGNTWQDVSAGLPEKVSFNRVFADEGEIVLVSEGGMFRSSISSTTPNWEPEVSLGFEISDLYPSQTGKYIGSYNKGLFQIIPGTEVLIPVHSTLKDKTVRCVLETPDGAVFVGCESGIFKSRDGGANWSQVFSKCGANSFVFAEGVLICGTYLGLMRSTDGGEHWETVLTEDGQAWKTGYKDGHFFTITQGGEDRRNNPVNRLRTSSDGGKTWQRMDENLSANQLLYYKEMSLAPVKDIFDLKKAGNYLFCSCNTGIFRSADWGKTWEPVFDNSGRIMVQLAVSGDVIYAVQVVGC